MKDINQSNLKHIKFRDWDLYVDYETTKNTYDNFIHDSCDCDECKNYALSKDDAFPDEIRKLFLDLEIDYKKECEADCCGEVTDGYFLYWGWFHFKGYFNGPDWSNDGKSMKFNSITETFKIGFHYRSDLTLFEDTNDLIQIEFETIVPWKLTDKKIE